MKDPAKLAHLLNSAKKAEEKAKENRIAAEEALIECLGKRDEGSKTHDAGDWSVTITAKTTRTMDWKSWAKASDSIPRNLWPVVEKLQLDTKGVKWLQENEPRHYKTLADCMTSKPAKTAVTIKRKS